MNIANENSESHASSTGHVLATSGWLDTHYLAMQPEYEEILRWVGIQPDWHVLDAGCGNGSYLRLMTELVGNGGRVSALDLAPENVQEVEARAGQGTWSAPVSARVGSVLDLPYDNHSLDAAWCANTSQYLTDEELRTMLGEMKRVVRPGGLIAIKDVDLTALQFQPITPTLTIHLCEAMCHAGDQLMCQCFFRTIELSQWLRAAGLLDIRQKPTLLVRLQPLRPVERTFVCDLLSFMSRNAQQVDLPPGESQLWKQLADVSSPDHITNHPDFQYRRIDTVFVGRVP